MTNKILSVLARSQQHLSVSVLEEDPTDNPTSSEDRTGLELLLSNSYALLEFNCQLCWPMEYRLVHNSPGESSGP